MLVEFKDLAIGEIYTSVDFDDPEYGVKFVKIGKHYARDYEHGVIYACDGDETVKVG